MRHIKIPNLFLIVGQPGNGKTSISNWFEKLLECEVLHTDQVYLSWLQDKHKAQYNAAKRNIRGHYLSMPQEFRRAFQDHANVEILAAIARAKMDLVVEGWLMLYIPEDLRRNIDAVCTVMRVHMRHYVAHVSTKTIKPQGKDYTNSVKSIIDMMAQSKGVNFMRRLVGYQSFEDIRDFQGVSDSLGKLIAMKLPANMAGKSVLDVECSTGYFTIRCWQRGAKAVGIDKRKQNVIAATRLATSVYRTHDPRFNRSDIYDWKTSEQYDYVLAINIMSSMKEDYRQFFDRAFELLKPGGTLVVELAVSCVHDKHLKHNEAHTEIREYAGKILRYPNQKELLRLAQSFTLTYRGRSVRMHGSMRRRIYHFTKPRVTSEAHTHSEHVLYSGASVPREEHVDSALQAVA